MTFASRRCEACNINYPPTQLRGSFYPDHMRCAHCGGGTVVSPLLPDEDWKERVKVLDAERVDRAQPVLDALAAEDEALGIIPLDGVTASHYLGQYWISVQEVMRAIYDSLRVGQIVRINTDLYEILGRREEPSRMYWARRFSMTLSDDDLRKLSSGD